MNNLWQRIAALALCFALTLGAFAYRPPTAKAIAVVDDAVVIGALLTAFSAGCGLIFSNNGMTSSEIASAMTTKWNEYKETLSDTVSSFSAWLGYDDMDALITDLRWDQVKECLAIPRAVARKFVDFATWLTDSLGVSVGGDSVSVASVSVPKYYRMAYDSDLGYLIDTEITYTLSTYVDSSHYSLGTPIFNLYDLPTTEDDALIFGTPRGAAIGLCVFYAYRDDSYAHFKSKASSFPSYNNVELGKTMVDGNVYLFMRRYDSNDDGLAWGFEYYDVSNGVRVKRFKEVGNTCVRFRESQVAQNALSVSTPAGVQAPDLSEDDTPSPALTFLDVNASTIEDLLQIILDQVQANTLAPTLDVAGTETGDNAGTDEDEDSKPYLPYIPRIFSKLETLPQDIADKVKGLFVPDEALLTEITDTFKGKFGFFSTLKQFADDLFGMTPTTDPPVIWVHLEDAESKYGYVYGDKQKILDLSWYQKYKADVDSLVGGFLWLAFLWLLFKRAAAIVQGGEMLAEYSHDFSQGRRDSNETKFQRYLWKD